MLNRNSIHTVGADAMDNLTEEQMLAVSEWAEDIARRAFHNGWKKAMLHIERPDLADYASISPKQSPISPEGLTDTKTDL